MLVDREANRSQLVDYLAGAYEAVELRAEPVEATLGECDLCLVDAVSFDRFRSALAAGREAANPVFLPYILVLTQGDPDDLDRETLSAVDDVLVAPIGQDELRFRIESLLRARRYSVDLERQNGRLARFADIVSHDLRNPLAIARGYLEKSRERGDQAPLDRVDQALRRMQAIVDDLLALARKGRVVESTEPVRLAASAEAAWDSVATGAADLALALDHATTIHADESRLLTLLENLFRNSVEHAGADVTVRVGLLDGEIGFYVEDDGPGIPSDDRDAVFEYGQSSTDSGTGFGLAIVSAVATAHGWSIRLVDAEPSGARFEITGDVEITAESPPTGSTTDGNPKD